MDHNQLSEDSKTSSSADESDRSDHANEMGTGRSYECVFCKRGFTTAQALGGHMNIHRKDRVKTKPSPAASNSAFTHATLRPNPVISQSQSHHQTPYPAPHHALSMASAEFRVGPTWCLGPTTSHDKDHELYYSSSNSGGGSNNNPQLLNNAFKAESWTTMSLSTRLAGASHSTDQHPQNIQENASEGNGEEDELDLELRLGHDR